VKAGLHYFHSAYVLYRYKYCGESAGDDRFDRSMMCGFDYRKKTFFPAGRTPRYHDCNTLLLDTQCRSQTIETLIHFQDRDPGAPAQALTTAQWTIANMRKRPVYFYCRRHPQPSADKTPNVHRGPATMLCALSGLYTWI
jgi:hypothetical protein